MNAERSSLDILQDQLYKCGFSPNNIKRNLKYHSTNKAISIADMVVYADEKIQDLTTSFISVFYIQNNKEKILEEAKFLATPVVFLLQSNDVEIIHYNQNESSKITYALLEHYFSENRLLYSKKELSTLKNSSGFQQILLFAIDATKELLTSTFDRIISEEKNRLGNLYVNEITKVAIHILAACVIEDKMWKDQSQNVVNLIHKCQQHLPNYFKGCLSSNRKIDIAQNVYSLSGELVIPAQFDEAGDFEKIYDYAARYN